MKKVVILIIAVLCIGGACGGYYYITQENKNHSVEDMELTEIQKLNTKNLDEKYPETPREVVKLFNRILMCYYKEEYKEDELALLTEQARKLMDDELLAVNTKDGYFQSVKADVAKYKEEKRRISQSSVCDSNDVKYLKDKGDELAYVTASYFIKEDSSYTKTFQEYVLRQNEDKQWKILTFYKIEGATDDE